MNTTEHLDQETIYTALESERANLVHKIIRDIADPFEVNGWANEINALTLAIDSKGLRYIKEAGHWIAIVEGFGHDSERYVVRVGVNQGGKVWAGADTFVVSDCRGEVCKDGSCLTCQDKIEHRQLEATWEAIHAAERVAIYGDRELTNQEREWLRLSPMADDFCVQAEPAAKPHFTEEERDRRLDKADIEAPTLEEVA